MKSSILGDMDKGRATTETFTATASVKTMWTVAATAIDQG